MMSSLHPSDWRMHHSDGSHRWSGGPPDRRGQEVYQAELQAHLAEHKAELREGPAPRQRRGRRLERAS